METNLSHIKKILSIAGSDSSGGAGIQADIKTISAHCHYAMTAITAITAQNTLGVSSTLAIPQKMLADQIDSVFTDVPPDAVKIGMLMNSENAAAVADRLTYYNAKSIVCDTVMVSTSGSALISEDGIKVYVDKLFPIADIITPNKAETERLSGVRINGENDIYTAGKILCGMTSGAVLIKGGHLDCSDYLFIDGKCHIIEGIRVNTVNSHGTGCTLSSAIACRLAEGKDICTAVRLAKEYVTAALSVGFDIGHGSGPLWHGVPTERV